MAALTATMSASVNVFGGAPSDTWAAYNWGSFLWGQGTASVPKTVRMLVGNGANLSLTPSASENYRLVKLLTPQSLTETDAVSRNFVRGLSETMGTADSLLHEYLQTANGYFYVFPEQVTDVVLRSTPTWSPGTPATVTWATYTVGSTSWS